MSRKPTETKTRILDVACELFVAKGYRDVTAQEICSKANANIASINYYFGSKFNLYLEVWKHAEEVAMETYLKPSNFEATPDGALEAYINARISSVLDEGSGGWLPRLISNEMHGGPAEEIKKFIKERIKEKLAFMYDLAKDFLGEGATDLQINIARQSFHSQCIHLNVVRHHKKEYFEESFKPNKDEVKAELIKMIMGGLRSYREEIRRGEK